MPRDGRPVTPVGGAGGPLGVTIVDSADGVDSPAPFFAVTRKA